jgi:two-component system, cell cycle sensor histidine kinase and response regulator CckA
MATSLKTLIIDDSADDAELLIRELRRESYDVSAERTDTEAGLKAALGDQAWDIVLCDFHMPRFSGIEALKIVRDRDPDVPFIFVSGAIGEDVAVGAMKAGAQDYVMKGNLKRLAPAIERELRDAAVRRERATAESRQRMMEARYRQILSIAPDAIIAMDEALHIAMFNQAAERLFGYSADEAIGQSAEALLPPRFVGPFREQIRQFGASADTTTQIRVPDKFCGRRKNGVEFPAEAYVSKMVEDRRTIFTTVIRDITERENMMATLRHTNQTLDAVVQSSPVAILGLDSSRRVIVWNRNAERIFGLSATDVVGRPFPPLVEVAGTQLGDTVRRLLEGEVLTDVEIHQPSKNSPLELRVSGAPLYDADQRVRGAVCIVEDVSESRATRRQLEHAQRMEAVGQLTGGLAHDFNNLLAVVIGNLDLLHDLPELRPSSKESVDLALKASLGGATLIRQLLAFSRRQALSPKALDLSALVVSTRELLSRTLGEHIEVEMRLAPDLWPAMADAIQVESAIANLAINARDAMPNGGRMTLETANKHLDPRYADTNPDAQPGDYVMLAVSDTGTGIPPEVLTRVFEPFFTTKEQGKGSGLGLSMVYGFAKQSRGHVKIYSEVGHGTTVRLYLPRAGEHKPDAAPASAPVASDADRIDAAILVVEDNVDVRRIVCRLLRDFGCTVIEASSGQAALDFLHSDQKIDLMFSDVVMPGGMSGTELVQAARRLRPGIKTLLTTGFAEASLRNQVKFADAGEIITKPYRRQDLARKLRSVLGLEA